jgi:hypothetical protein
VTPPSDSTGKAGERVAVRRFSQWACTDYASELGYPAYKEDMFVLASDYDALQARYDALRKTLLAIANAKPSEWDPDVRDQFQLWAQNIARAATGKGQL